MAQLLVGSFPALSLADAILDRLMHNAHKIHLVAEESIRKWRGRWAEHVAGIVAPRPKFGRAKR